MKQFLRENLAIVAAIVLPLILVAGFALSTAAINRMVADPQYDFLIATNVLGGANESFYFDVVDSRLQISYAYPSIKAGVYPNTNLPRLWRVRVPSMTVEEISLVPPARGKDDEDGKRVPVNIAGVSGLRVAATQPAPDGYVFQESYDYYGGNLMREIFSGSGGRSRDRCAIVKDGRAVAVRNLGGNSFSYYNLRFIGWITKNP